MSKEIQFKTSDGYRFRSAAKADAHAQTLKDRTVEQVTVGGESPKGGKAAASQGAAVPAPPAGDTSETAGAASPAADADKAAQDVAQAASASAKASPAPKASGKNSNKK